MPKLKEKKIRIIDQNGQSVILPQNPGKKFSLHKFFYSAKTAPLPEKNVPKSNSVPHAPSDLSVVRSWVALEERIVHDYQERKPFFSIRTPFGKPAQEKPSVFETVSIQTTTAVFPPEKKTKSSAEKAKKPSFHLGILIFGLGWVLAGVIVFFYARELPQHQDTASRLARNQGENKQLERFAAEYKAILGEQRKELQEANRQLRSMAVDLKVAQVKAQAYDSMEKAYREELFRVTAQYEGQMEQMRQILQSRDDFSKTLQEHIRAIDKLVSEGGLATAFSAAVAAVQGERAKAIGDARQSPQQNIAIQGKVMMVNRRYQFIVIDLGSEQGTRVGGLVDIFHKGQRMTSGRIEKVYPAMSAVAVFDEKALGELEEGDVVSFSSL